MLEVPAVAVQIKDVIVVVRLVVVGYTATAVLVAPAKEEMGVGMPGELLSRATPYVAVTVGVLLQPGMTIQVTP